MKVIEYKPESWLRRLFRKRLKFPGRAVSPEEMVEIVNNAIPIDWSAEASAIFGRPVKIAPPEDDWDD